MKKINSIFLILFFLIKCQYNEIPFEDKTTLNVRISALTETCSGDIGLNPFKEIDRVKVIIVTPEGEIEREYNIKEKTQIKIKGVPEGSKNKLTIVGYSSSEPDSYKWFGRKHNLTVIKDRENHVELVLTRYGKFTCINPPPPWTNRIFPSVIDLKDGRILITGGWTRAEIDKQNPQYFRIYQASDLALIYHFQNGKLEQLPTKMIQARGGHESVYLPAVETAKLCSSDKDCPSEFNGKCDKNGVCIKADSGEIIKGDRKDLVLIFGGATEIKMKTDEKSFPFEIDKNKALNTYEIFDIKEMKFINPAKDSKGKDKKMTRNRVFPKIARLSDNSVLITGGGKWPKEEDPGYQDVELWAPWEDYYKGNFMDLFGELRMQTMRSGHSVTYIGDTPEGLSRYLFYGGTTATNKDEFLIEIYTQSSQQAKGVNGVFKSVKAPAQLPLRFFHSLTPLKGNSFLLAGGVDYKPQTHSLILPNIAKIYVIKLFTNPEELTDTIEVEEIPAPESIRFFHSATSHDGIHVTLLGGFLDFSSKAQGDIRFFDYEKKTFGLPVPTVELIPRIGHSAIVLSDDTILLAGGIREIETLKKDTLGMLEIFTPNNIKIKE